MFCDFVVLRWSVLVYMRWEDEERERERESCDEVSVWIRVGDYLFFGFFLGEMICF